MIDLILQLIIFFSFAIIVYLLAIAVPRVRDDELTAAGGQNGGALPLERMDAFLNAWKEKSLRRLRIYLLKAESSVAKQLQKSREVYQREKQRHPLQVIKRKKILEKREEITEEEQTSE